jgi:predicted RNA-binding protein
MCLARIYLTGADKPVMEQVTRITVEEGKISVETLFGEQRYFDEPLRRVDFAEAKVWLGQGD